MVIGVENYLMLAVRNLLTPIETPTQPRRFILTCMEFAPGRKPSTLLVGDHIDGLLMIFYNF